MTAGDIFLMFWAAFKPFLFVAAVFLIVQISLLFLKRRWLHRAGMPEIDRMSGRDFEECINVLLARKGYRVELTPYVGDWGADLVVSHDGVRSVVQLKRWNRAVNPRAVQEVVASKAKYRCERAMVITNSHFTRAARELARVNRVELWDRTRLARELLQSGIPGSPAVPPSAPALDQPESATPQCSRCGRGMVLRIGKHGRFWGCSGFPQCRHTRPISA